jgi:hypothetical protein
MLIFAEGGKPMFGRLFKNSRLKNKNIIFDWNIIERNCNFFILALDSKSDF